MTSCCTAFAAGLPSRLLSLPRKPLLSRRPCPTPPYRRRAARMVSTASSTSGIEVRRAVAADVRDVAQVVVRAFCEDDSVVRRLRELQLLKQVGALEFVEDLYERMCYIEVVEQLARRLVEPERKGVQKEAAKKHVVLVAIDQQEGCVVGCIEMGVVNVPRLLAGGILNEVRQWEENVRSAGRERESSESIARKSSGNGAAGPTQRTPYIGNLAVLSSHRRLGVGSVLVRYAQRHAILEWGQNTVCLHVEAGNEGAKRLYASLGFSCEMVEPEWYAEVGRPRRMFLRSGNGEEKREVADAVKEWENAKVVGRNRGLGPVEYLRFCWWDLGRRKRELEKEEEVG